MATLRNGILIGSNGEILTSSGTTITGRRNGLPIDADGRLVVSNKESENPLVTLTTIDLTPTSSSQTISLTANEISNYELFRVTDTSYTGTVISFTNCTADKLIYARNSDLGSNVTFGTVSVPAGYIVQILVAVGGATTAITDPIVYDPTTTDTKTSIIVAANNSSEAWKARALYTCTGSADQTIINNALEAYSGGKVMLAPGTYNTNGFIQVSVNTTLCGANPNTSIIINTSTTNTIRLLSGAELCYLNVNNTLISSSADIISSSADNVSVHDCNVGRGSNAPTSSATYIALLGNYSIISNNVISRGYGTIINVGGSYNIVQRNNITLYSNSFTNVGVYSSCAYGIIDNNIITTNVSGGIGLYIPSGVGTIVVNNKINYNNTSYALTTGIYNGVVNASFLKNFIGSCSGHGINSTVKCNIQGNTMLFPSALTASIAINVNGDESIIGSNTITMSSTSATQNCIVVAGTGNYNQIKNNIISMACTSTGIGIQLAGTSNIGNIVSANTIKFTTAAANTDTYGMGIGAGENLTINGNNIRGYSNSYPLFGAINFSGDVNKVVIDNNNLQYVSSGVKSASGFSRVTIVGNFMEICGAGTTCIYLTGVARALNVTGNTFSSPAAISDAMAFRVTNTSSDTCIFSSNMLALSNRGVVFSGSNYTPIGNTGIDPF